MSPLNPLFILLLQKGLELSWLKLLKKKQKDDGIFVFLIDGKIVHIRARDIPFPEEESPQLPD